VRDLGLVQLLVGQIRHDVGVLSQPSGPALCATPDRPGRSPRASFNLNSSLTGGGGWGGRSGGGMLAGEPLGGGGLARDGSSSLAAAVIPEDAEGVVAGPAASPYAHATGHFTLSRNISFQARHVEAGALRAAAGGPAPLARLCGALLVREVAAGAGVGPGMAQVLVHATLLPVLHMQVSNRVGWGGIGWGGVVGCTQGEGGGHVVRTSPLGCCGDTCWAFSTAGMPGGGGGGVSALFVRSPAKPVPCWGCCRPLLRWGH
jgi:hypothetical protein